MKVSLFQGILIGVFGAGAVFGLFAFSTYSGGSVADEIGTVVIWGTLSKVDIDTTFQRISDVDKSIQRISYVQKNPLTLAAELASAIATGASPDLILASQEDLNALSRFVTPIPTATIPVSTFKTAFIDAASVLEVPRNGGHYGIPYLVDPLILFWNNDILSSNGIAKPPATWEALSGLASTLAVISPTKQINRGLIALGTYDNVQNARGILSALFFQARVPMSGYEQSGRIASSLGDVSVDGSIPPGESVLRFYTQFADPTKVSYTWNGSLPNSRRMFQTGDLALYLGYASESHYFSLANPNLNFNVAPLPQPATATIKNTHGLLYSLMVSSGSRNPTGAYKAAILLTKTDFEGIAAWVTGLAPASRTALTSVQSDPTAAVAYSSALYAKGWLSPTPTSVDQVFSSMIGDVVSGRSEVRTALGRAAGSLNLLFQQ